MKQYDVVLFDLDGTLTDPVEGITNSVAYALRKFGLEVPERKELHKYIGPTLAESFGEFCGFEGEQITRAIAYYREYYQPYGINQNLLYDGVEEMLKQLTNAGKKVLVATSKPEPFARKILEDFGLTKYFTYIAGANIDETRGEKAEVIEYALETCGITDRERVIMVGDRKYDVVGAQKNGLRCIGVTYGYGGREELEAAGAVCVAEGPMDVVKIILGQ